MRVEIDHPFEDSVKEECGIFAVYGLSDAVTYTILGLHALQHRGQEAAGIVALDEGTFLSHKSTGLVGDVFNAEAIAKTGLKGTAAIGHVRYSTAGGGGEANIQPFTANTHFGKVALAHNGNLTNSEHMRNRLLEEGRTFQSSSDTEVILHLMALSKETTPLSALKDALGHVEGAYSLVVLTESGTFGMRDPNGFRPLVIGKLDGQYMLASETCALDIIGAEFVRDVKPGEIIELKDGSFESHIINQPQPNRFCIFEYVYFMRPNSQFGGKYISNVREKIGAELFREHHTPADVVIPVPDSGVHAAVGYAETAGIPYKQGIIRSHYVGRTFIEPTDRIRHFGVKMKLSVNAANVQGRRVILIDDSIVRGTTMPKIVDMVRKAGATEVHVRISSPPFANPCFYGIDTPRHNELAANNMSLSELTKFTGADSLAYISVDGLYRAVGAAKRDEPDREFCDACFTGEYPVSLTDKTSVQEEKIAS